MKKTDQNQDIIDSYNYLGKAASAMDCTGLIPSLPHTRAELESYEALYSYRPDYIADRKDPKEETDL